MPAKGEHKGGPCAYCQAARAVNWDHVVPRSLVRRYNRSAPLDAPSIPAEWLVVVGACFACNIRKGSRRLVPPSWAKQVHALNRFFGGTPFRVWAGDTKEPAFAEAWQ
jgi:5-methylcytosine-specific restriction endonuclease McrA